MESLKGFSRAFETSLTTLRLSRLLFPHDRMRPCAVLVSMLCAATVNAFTGVSPPLLRAATRTSMQKPSIASCASSRGQRCSISMNQQKSAVSSAVAEPVGLPDKFWNWKGYKIRYQSAGEENTGGPSLVLIHGFGGNADHWRKNTPELAKAGFRVFAIDLIGYGYSDKPDPQSMQSVNGELSRDLDSYLRFAPDGAERYGGVGETPFTDMAHPLGSGYNFYTWADQVRDFMEEVVGEKAFAICNSIGSCAGMQVAVDHPEWVRGVMICDPSLRLLNVKRQNPLGIPLVTAFQTLLRETPIGESFFSLVAKEQTVSNILKTAYGNPDTVTPELVQAILKPGMTENAPRVFLDFISYSAGPLPEEQLHILSSEEYKSNGKPRIPISILWGEKDPWEPVEEGRKYAEYECVEEFVPLAGAGHCPQDEVPELVNPRVVDFVKRHL